MDQCFWACLETKSVDQFDEETPEETPTVPYEDAVLAVKGGYSERHG